MCHVRFAARDAVMCVGLCVFLFGRGGALVGGGWADLRLNCPDFLMHGHVAGRWQVGRFHGRADPIKRQLR